MTVLLSAADLAARIGRGDPLTILDVRWKLGGPPGADEFERGHIPGAVYVDLDSELAAPASKEAGRHPLPSPDALQAAARSWGIRTGDTVVAYDDLGGLSAARAWWLLRWGGLTDVLLLDGGLAAWRAEHGPAATGPEATAEAGDVVLAGGGLPVLDADGVAAHVAAGGLLLDARSGDRYRGEPNPIDPRLGHVPGAVSAPATENLTAAGTFASPAELEARFRALGAADGRPAAAYCGSGVTAAHDIAALALAGIEDVALYPGSWSQWGNDPSRPVATGAEPGGLTPPR